MEHYRRWLISITIIVLAAGWLGTIFAVRVAEDELRSKLLLRTATAAAMISYERVERLTATAADLDSPDYKYLYRQIMETRSLNPDCSYVYLLKMVDGKLVFAMDSDDENASDFSPPGEEYNEASAELRNIFINGTPFVEGPLGDQWGVWVSGLAAVRHPEDGRVLAVLGLDIDVREWQEQVALARFTAISVTAMVLVLMFTVFYALRVSTTAAHRVYLAEKQAKEAAEAVSEAKSQFLAYLSHEIRTPVNGILGLGELLQATLLDIRQREYVSAIAYSARSLLTVLNDVLDFAKIEAKKMTIEISNFEFRALIAGVNKILQAGAANKGIGLATVIDPAIPKVVGGDPARLQQVLLNIGGNAIKFTDAGQVEIKAECQEQDEHTIRIKVTVTDTGIGLSPDEIDKLFQPFSQAEGANARKYLGSGLGLSISANLIELMGGEFGVTSKKGAGSVFWFTLPFTVTLEKPDILSVNRQQTDSILPVWLTQPSVRKGEAAGDVLIVEDNPVNQQVVKAQIKRLGLTPDLAGNGQEAVDMAAKTNYKLIFMDCGLPILDGFAATRMIREREAGTGQHTPIIALTADFMIGEREKYLAAGMDDGLVKPVSGKELSQVIERWLPTESVDSIDLAVLGELNELACSGQVDVSEFIDAYLAEQPLITDKLKQAILNGDAIQVRAHAHSLKSMSATIGATRLAELFRQLEQEASKGNGAELKGIMMAIDGECRQVGIALKNAANLFKLKGTVR